MIGDIRRLCCSLHVRLSYATFDSVTENWDKPVVVAGMLSMPTESVCLFRDETLKSNVGNCCTIEAARARFDQADPVGQK